MRNILSLRREAPEDLLEIHPETAAEYDIEDGAAVSVESPRGRIMCRAKIAPKIVPGVVHLYFGYEDSNANVLTDHAAFDPVTGSTGLKSLLCKVEKV
jgi:anaerobic selenocysteine-containing dehydrogenase